MLAETLDFEIPLRMEFSGGILARLLRLWVQSAKAESQIRSQILQRNVYGRSNPAESRVTGAWKARDPFAEAFSTARYVSSEDRLEDSQAASELISRLGDASESLKTDRLSVFRVPATPESIPSEAELLEGDRGEAERQPEALQSPTRHTLLPLSSPALIELVNPVLNCPGA